MLQLPVKIHRNHQLFSDHYLDETLPQRSDWLDLVPLADPVMVQVADYFAQYVPSDKEEQIERDLIRPILEVLGHTFEVQVTLQVPGAPQYPDYIFYRDKDALNANKGQSLTEELLQTGAFAVGDAKFWMSPLDVPRKSGSILTNKNPSYQIAFYMQHSGLDWGILTNGRYWRLYHKDTAHKLDHYYEVDLVALLQSNDVSQFLYFYAFFRRAAFDQHPISVAAMLQESYEYAQDIGTSLKEQVYDALRLVAQGFLTYPPNHLSADDADTLKAIYDNSLILLYRLLFIFYAEARDLLALRESDLYREYYSLYEIKQRVASSLSLQHRLRPNSAKLYNDLQQLFWYINEGDVPLHIATFNGGLFDSEKHPFLEKYRVSDEQFQLAIDMLARVKDEFIDYRDLSVRNLGTIYEGLLEHHLEQVTGQDGWNIDLVNEKGERQATGSYYTPDYIVKYIVAQTVGPVLSAKVVQVSDDRDKVNAVLEIKVLDPSMGSAHFLVEATEYIARFLVELNAQKEDAKQEADLAYWKRRVVQSCIYGVDLNPLAVELAKLSLWLNTVAKDRPLSFLDHHLRTGNAVIGTHLADLSVPPNSNGPVRKKTIPGEQLSLFDDEVFRQNIEQAVNLMWLVEDSPAQTIDQVKEQEQLYAEMRAKLVGKYGTLADLHTAAHYGIAVDSALWKPIMDFATGRILTAPAQFTQWLNEARQLAQESRHRFFHWELEFPEVFFDKYGQSKRDRAGFDAVIGNPPWIRQETFSQDKPVLKLHYATYSGQADLSTYFVELGNTYLKESGHFGFIIPNKFVRARYGEALRNFLAEQVTLKRIVNFGDLPVFADTVTYPMIVLTSKRKNEDTQVAYSYLKKLRPDNLAEDIEDRMFFIPQALFIGKYWSLSGEKIHAIVDKMQNVGIPFGEYTQAKLLYGIKTGLNKAFLIDRHTRDRLIATDPRSAEIIKPVVEGEDVRRYSIDNKHNSIILSKIGTPIEKYPAVFAHLQQYQTQLEKRGDKGKYWWELRTCDYYDAFEGAKIIYPDIAAGCRFAFDTEGIYSLNTTYILPLADNQKYLIPLLNSSLIEFFYATISVSARGGYLRFFTEQVKQIPIRPINFATSLEERATRTDDAIKLYQTHQRAELLASIDTCLHQIPEQSDVVHDILIALAEQIIHTHKQRQAAIEDFMLGLESVLADADLHRLSRLWTPSSGLLEDQEAYARLGALASQVVVLRDHIGALNEDQWKWLIKRRLIKPDLVDLVKVYRKYQPPVAQLERQIATIDALINQIVYRLYGLTAEEIAVVEEHLAH